MHQIELRLQAQIAADGAGTGLLHRIRPAGELAERGYRAGPSRTAASTGPEVMNSSNEAKNGLSACSA